MTEPMRTGSIIKIINARAGCSVAPVDADKEAEYEFIPIHAKVIKYYTIVGYIGSASVQAARKRTIASDGFDGIAPLNNGPDRYSAVIS